MGFENSISITYGLLDYIFQILDTENVSVKQIMPCLAVLAQKSENGIANIIKKPHNFVTKTKSYLKSSKWPWEITSRFLKGGERRKAAGHERVFYWNLGVTTYTLENHSTFKSKFSFNNGSILIILELGEIPDSTICLNW